MAAPALSAREPTPVAVSAGKTELTVGGVVPEIERGIELAVATIDSGAALAKLHELVAFTRARAPEAA